MTVDTGGDLGRILGVWAHPDDETWLSAGLMASAVAAGRRVVCVTATRGEAGFAAGDPRSLQQRASLREAELAASLGLLGVTEHRWLGYSDGGCAAVDDAEGSAAISAVIAEVRPDTVLTFGPDGATGHPDHVAVCRWTTLAIDAAGRDVPRLLYATKTAEWNRRSMAVFASASVMMIEGFEAESVEPSELAVLFDCTEELVERKVAALRAQASQIEALFQAAGLDVFSDLIREEFFRERRAADRDTLAQATAFSRRAS